MSDVLIESPINDILTPECEELGRGSGSVRAKASTPGYEDWWAAGDRRSPLV